MTWDSLRSGSTCFLVFCLQRLGFVGSLLAQYGSIEQVCMEHMDLYNRFGCSSTGIWPSDWHVVMQKPIRFNQVNAAKSIRNHMMPYPMHSNATIWVFGCGLKSYPIDVYSWFLWRFDISTTYPGYTAKNHHRFLQEVWLNKHLKSKQLESPTTFCTCDISWDIKRSHTREGKSPHLVLIIRKPAVIRKIGFFWDRSRGNHQIHQSKVRTSLY